MGHQFMIVSTEH